MKLTTSRQKQVLVVVSTVLFALLALAAVVFTDLQDRSFPEQLGAQAAADLDFAESGLSDDEAFAQLGTLSDRFNVGLVKVGPDLRSDQAGEVFVAVGNQGPSPTMIERFGSDPDARVTDRSALANSYASGQYLATGETIGLGAFRTELAELGVVQEWTDDSFKTTLEFILRQGSFVVTVVAAVALIMSLVLYWLSVKAKSRALRVLAGAPGWRIQLEDLAGFLSPILTGAALSGAIATGYVGLVHGWSFVPSYLGILLTFDTFIVAAATACAVAMSVASRPGIAMLAARQPAVTSLRTTSMVLKAATFALVLLAVTPALGAYADSRKSATEQAQWRSLADQVSLSFSGSMGEAGFQEIKQDVGELVEDAEQDGSAALSYTWDEAAADEDFGTYDSLSLVNETWLGLVLEDDGSAVAELTPLSPSEVPEGARQLLGPGLAEVWSRHPVPVAEALDGISFIRYAGSVGIPVVRGGGGGELVFPGEAILAVLPDLYSTLNDDFLASAASTRNLVFRGLGPTQALISQHGLEKDLQVRYVAEDGILRAQFAAYFAWLQGASLVALVVALAVSALVAAFITAVLQARRDFPLRLAGKRWAEILCQRVTREWLAGVVLVALVITIQRWQGVALVAAVGVIGLLGSSCVHAVAARWAFANVGLRKL